MASMFNRLTFAALFASLIAAPEALAQTTPAADQPVATSAPASAAPRPLDDDRYAPPPSAAPSDTVAPVNRPPGVVTAPAPVSSAPLSASAPAAATPPPPVKAPPEAAPPSSRSSRRARHAEPAAPAAEAAKPEFKMSVEGKVVEAGVKTHPIKVGKGDTVNVIAERLSTDKDELIKANKLKKPYELQLGQVIQIPTPKAYEVQSGDTLYSIGKRFGVSADALGEINDLDVADHLRAGHKIFLPTDVEDHGPIKTPIAPSRGGAGRFAPIAGEPVPLERPSADSGDEAAHRVAPPSRLAPPAALNGAPVVEAAPAPSDAQVMAAGKGRFAWPVSGTILSTYGPKAGGQRNDGVDIAAAMGAPVLAAADGDVVYAGNQVPGFGNLVLIKHADGWVTAYAHLSRTEVKIKDHVSQGDEIGQAGQTGGVDQPQLHFEIRYAPSPRDKARPIDPGLVLPNR